MSCLHDCVRLAGVLSVTVPVGGVGQWQAAYAGCVETLALRLPLTVPVGHWYPMLNAQAPAPPLRPDPGVPAARALSTHA